MGFHLREYEKQIIMSMYEQNVPEKQIAKDIGRQDATVRHFLRSQGLVNKYYADPDNFKEQIIQLHKLGKYQWQIADELKLGRSTICRFFKKNNLRPNGPKPIEIVDQNTARCSRCEEIKSMDNWPKQKNIFASFCRDCLNKQNWKRTHRDIETIMQIKIWRISQRSSISLKAIDLVNLWNHQNGLCFYTGFPMILSARKTTGELWSIDRVIPSAGYKLGNVVLCQHRINTAKSNFSLDELMIWMPTWYQKIIEFLISSDGLGTGLSEMEKRCPRTFQVLQQMLASLENTPVTV